MICQWIRFLGIMSLTSKRRRFWLQPFDAAWEKVKASDGSLAAEQHAAATRELLAKGIIAMVEQPREIPID